MDFETQLEEILKPFPDENYKETQIGLLTALAKTAWDQRNKAHDLLDFVTQQRDELAEQLEDEKLSTSLMLQTIRDGEKTTERITERALLAEANETTFRHLLMQAHDVLAKLPTTSTSITHLRYQILDTLNETASVKERMEG